MSNQMTKLFETRIKLIDGKKLVIENYESIKDLNDDYIIIDSYLIRGQLLRIKQVTTQILVIHGKIKEIIIL